MAADADPLLERARALAREAHAGQTYNGRPYAEHLRRVAAGAARRTADPLTQVVAWLHDLVEDTPWTLEEVEAIFGREVAADLGLLTRRTGESYAAYLARIPGRPRALLVKLADLEDNLAGFSDPSCAKPPALREKYLEARAFLLEQAPGAAGDRRPGE